MMRLTSDQTDQVIMSTSTSLLSFTFQVSPVYIVPLEFEELLDSLEVDVIGGIYGLWDAVDGMSDW